MIFFCNKVLGTQYNILQIQIIKYIDVKPINNVIFRSNSPEVFCKKGVPKNFAKFTRKHLYWSLVFDKVAGQAYNIIKKKIPAQVFSCIVILRKFQEHLFYRYLRATASIVTYIILISKYNMVFQKRQKKQCQSKKNFVTRILSCTSMLT